MAAGQESLTNLEIRRLETEAEFREALDVEKRVWGFADVELVPWRLMVVATESGGWVAGAFDGDTMIGFKLPDFFLKLLDNIIDLCPIEARAGRFPTNLAGFEHGRLGAGDAVEDGFLRVVRVTVGLASVALFLRLNLLPAVQDLARSFGRLIAEDVRMPPDQFLVNVAKDIFDGKLSLFRGDLGLKSDLQLKVPQLFNELGPVASLDGFDGFVGFFDQVRAQGLERLFPVPGAAARTAQPRHDRHEPVEFRG